MRMLLLPIFALLALTGSVFAQEVMVRPYRVLRATVKDTSLIQLFLKEQAIYVNETVDSLEFVDATANGFGQGDLMILFPSQQALPLLTVEEPLRSIMNDWSYNANQLTSPDTSSAQLLDSARVYRDPYAGLLGHVLRGLETYYSGSTIEGAFRRDAQTSYIGLWNFDEDAFRYRDAPLSGGASDTVEVFDLLHVISKDTLYLVDSVLYDAIYVYKTYRDTVFVPVPDTSARSGE